MGHHDLLFRDTFQRLHAARWLIACAHPELAHLPITRVDPVTVSTDCGERRTDLLFHLGESLAIRIAVQHESPPTPCGTSCANKHCCCTTSPNTKAPVRSAAF